MRARARTHVRIKSDPPTVYVGTEPRMITRTPHVKEDVTYNALKRVRVLVQNSYVPWSLVARNVRVASAILVAQDNQRDGLLIVKPHAVKRAADCVDRWGFFLAHWRIFGARSIGTCSEMQGLKESGQGTI